MQTKRTKEKKDTLIYPLSEDAMSKLRQLIYFSKITKIAIGVNDKGVGLIIDHIDTISHPDYGLVPGYKGEESKRTIINFNYSKDEIKYK